MTKDAYDSVTYSDYKLAGRMGFAALQHHTAPDLSYWIILDHMTPMEVTHVHLQLLRSTTLTAQNPFLALRNGPRTLPTDRRAVLSSALVGMARARKEPL